MMMSIQREIFQNDPENSLTTAMMLLAQAITQCYSTPTNNQLRSFSNTKNQTVVQADKVNIQSKNVGNNCRIARRSYNVQEESAESSNCYNCNEKGHYARNCPKPRVRDSKYFMEQMLLAKKDEAGVILSNNQNDFLLADVVQMEELEELSVNICMMAKIQPANIDSNEEPSYYSTFISEVQTPFTSYMNPLFTNSNHEQTYLEQPKIINYTIGDDQINSDIIFDDPNVEVNSGSVEHDKKVHDSHDNKLEQLARNAYKEAEKQQMIANKKELIEADHKAKRLETELQNQFIRDRDKIRALEKERDDLQLNVSEQRKHVEAKMKKNENVVIKMSQSVQALFMLGPKHLSFYDPKLKHGLGYENPYTLKKAISHNPKLYDASCLHSSKVHVNVCDTGEILEDANKSQIKMENKMKDPIAIEKKQNLCSIDYKNLNALYETFVPQVELSAEQKYFSSVSTTSETSSNASTSSSPPTTMPSSSKLMKHFHKMETDFEKSFTLLEINSTLKTTLKHDVEKCVLMSNDFVNDNSLNEIEKVKRESVDVQENLHIRIKILEYDVQRCQK
ncbi:retrovirus-related pol polyprotein from transposon TNT 1-94 [Tanacetum coccineum]